MKFLKKNIENWQRWKMTFFWVGHFEFFFFKKKFFFASLPWKLVNIYRLARMCRNFDEKILRIGGAGKWGFFEAAILNFLSRPFWIFFCFISVKNPALLYEVTFFSAIWMVFSESWKRSCSNFNAHDCIYILWEYAWIYKDYFKQ